MRSKLFVLAAVAFAIALPAAAGEYEKCSYDTQACLDKMVAKMQNKGWVGIEYKWDEESSTLTLEKVTDGSPAAKAGLAAGDQLVAMNGVGFAEENEEKLKAMQKEMTPGKVVTYTVVRGDHKKPVEITLAEMPQDVIVKWVGHHMLQHAKTEAAAN